MAAPYFTMSQVIARPAAEVFTTDVPLDEFLRWSPQNPSEEANQRRDRWGHPFQVRSKGFGKITNELRGFDPTAANGGSLPAAAMAGRGSITNSRHARGGPVQADQADATGKRGKPVGETAAPLQRYLERQ